jgi:hypothetical protein
MILRGSTAVVLMTLVLLGGACRSETAHGDLAEKVTSFDQYPLVWLGPSYDVDGDGQPDAIRTARTASSPAFYDPTTGQLIRPEVRMFTISYGSCEIPDGASACPIPLTMVSSAPCETEPLSDIAKAGSVSVRGIDAIVQLNGGIRLETADFSLTVLAVADSDKGTTEKALRIARDLIPANAKAKSALTGSTFRATARSLRRRKQRWSPEPGCLGKTSACGAYLYRCSRSSSFSFRPTPQRKPESVPSA